MSARFEYYAPRSVPETLEILTRCDGKALVLAGVTDIVPKLQKGTLDLGAVISLRHRTELRGIDFDSATGLTISATTRIAEVMDHPAVRSRYLALVEALSQLATVQVRNMAQTTGLRQQGLRQQGQVLLLHRQQGQVLLLHVRSVHLLLVEPWGPSFS